MLRNLDRLAGLLAVCALVGTGCAISESFSNSSNSISESVSNSSNSSSNSSSGGDGAYHRDVSAYILAWVEAEAEPEALWQELSRIAAAHGVVDWEDWPATYAAVGAGLREAGLDEAAARQLGERIFGPDPRIQSALLEGYAS